MVLWDPGALCWPALIVLVLALFACLLKIRGLIEQRQLLEGVLETAHGGGLSMKTLARLVESEKRYRYLFENMPDGYLVCGIDGEIRQANPAAAALLGYASPKELEARNMMSDVYENAAQRETLVARLQEGDLSVRYRLRFKRKDGSLVHTEGNIRLVTDALGIPTAVEGVFRDIDEQLRMEAELKRLASTDPLTRTLNRRAFMERLEDEIQRARRYGRTLSIISLDIDHFKRVNDRFGHPAGDKVLRQFAIACTDLLRSTDALGRLGGEEFSIAMPETDESRAMAVAERILREIEKQLITFNNESIRITVSLGVTSTSRSGFSIYELLKHADMALYTAKKEGRNRVIFWEEGGVAKSH